MIYKGRCLCGSIEYQVVGEPVIVAHCHCEDCQRLTGAGHSTGAMYALDKFQMTGNVSEYKLQSANGNQVTRVFCPNCGSPILGKNTAMEGFVTVSLGTLEDASDFKPEVVIFAENRNPWDFMDEDIESFDRQPEWKPNKGE